jgi:hypothetical protein
VAPAPPGCGSPWPKRSGQTGSHGHHVRHCESPTAVIDVDGVIRNVIELREHGQVRRRAAELQVDHVT